MTNATLIILLIISLIVFSVPGYFIYRSASSEVKSNNMLSFIFAGIILIASNFVQFFLSKNERPDYIDLNRPYIQPTLYFEKVDSKGYIIKYDIVNNGSLPANNIKCMFKTENFVIAEFQEQERDLAPKAQMSYKPVPIQTTYLDSNAFYHFVLAMSYKANIDGKERMFRTTYMTTLSKDQIKVGSNYLFDRSQEEVGSFSEKEIRSFMNIFNEDITNKKWPGISLNTGINLKSSNNSNQKYILDAGIAKNHDRISILTNQYNDLIFRAIDMNSNSYEVLVPYDSIKTVFNNPIYLNCEIGNVNNFSFMAIKINCQSVAYKEIRPRLNLNISNETFLSSGIIGADLGYENNGFFELNSFFKYDSTLAANVKQEILDSLSNKHRYKVFNGDKWSKLNKFSKGNKLFN